MPQFPFLCSERVRCDVCRTAQSIGQTVKRGSLRLCSSCARPRVVHENELLERLLRGEQAQATGPVRRWFSC
jgi:hypothetical protein